MTPAKPILPIIQSAEMSNFASRFWSRVERGAPYECWPWRGALHEQGYGQLTVAKRPLKAHRVAYVLHSGADPDPMLRICHSCDNPRCCNPDHLWLGTQKQNVRDAMDKARFGRFRTLSSRRRAA